MVKSSQALVEVIMYDVLAKMVKHEKTDGEYELLINVIDLSSGFYVTHVYFGNQKIAVHKAEK